MFNRNAMVEDMNYFNDSRVRAGDHWYESLDETRMIAFVPHYDDEVLEIPFVYEVCSTCRGKGTHVNPSIDCNGLSAEDFAEDPDFAEAYFGGAYDMPCNECGGHRVSPTVDESRKCPDLEKLHEKWEDEAISRAEYMAERRMGA